MSGHIDQDEIARLQRVLFGGSQVRLGRRD